MEDKLKDILQSSISNIDDDWLEYIIKEIIFENKEETNSVLSLQALLENDLSCFVKQNQLLPICKKLFEVLHPVATDEKDEKKEEGEDEEDEDGAYVEDGCCLMCEREMPLTKHHLIPREVHEWHKKHNGRTHAELHTGIMICRDCHSAIHSYIDNRTLGFEYYTLEKLLEHPSVQKWIPYIRKQKLTNKTDRRTWVQKHPTDMPPEYDSEHWSEKNKDL